jgi:hypothetical protein
MYLARRFPQTIRKSNGSRILLNVVRPPIALIPSILTGNLGEQSMSKSENDQMSRDMRRLIRAFDKIQDPKMLRTVVLLMEALVKSSKVKESK